MLGVYELGKKAIYHNPITNMKADCEVAKETDAKANVIPVNIFNEHREMIYRNAWVSKENLTFE